jgi:hypothetical protein
MPVDSTTPSFASTLGSSGVYQIESTSVRKWQGPSNRSIRVASLASDDFYIAFGTSLIAPSTLSMLLLGGTIEAFYLTPSQTFVAVKSSTDVIVNFTPGYGG